MWGVNTLSSRVLRNLPSLDHLSLENITFDAGCLLESDEKRILPNLQRLELEHSGRHEFDAPFDYIKKRQEHSADRFYLRTEHFPFYVILSSRCVALKDSGHRRWHPAASCRCSERHHLTTPTGGDDFMARYRGRPLDSPLFNFCQRLPLKLTPAPTTAHTGMRLDVPSDALRCFRASETFQNAKFSFALYTQRARSLAAPPHRHWHITRTTTTKTVSSCAGTTDKGAFHGKMDNVYGQATGRVRQLYEQERGGAEYVLPFCLPFTFDSHTFLYIPRYVSTRISNFSIDRNSPCSPPPLVLRTLPSLPPESCLARIKWCNERDPRPSLLPPFVQLSSCFSGIPPPTSQLESQPYAHSFRWNRCTTHLTLFYPLKSLGKSKEGNVVKIYAVMANAMVDRIGGWLAKSVSLSGIRGKKRVEGSGGEAVVIDFCEVAYHLFHP
ncbi:hypothetical protein NMY22_g10023 [Coprinellus aureogranulatus]|nr:hypothetical protein NMY22_g10023 [Coprinellus aureogranulatus]